MKDFNLDRQKALELATELSLEVSFDSEKPGVYILNNGDETFYKFQDFLPEIFNYTLWIFRTHYKATSIVVMKVGMLLFSGDTSS